MITDGLFRFAEGRPDRPFLIWESREISFGEMAGMVSAYAAQLAEKGVRSGQSVALICGNRPAFLVAWFALSELGAVAVPLNTSLLGDGLRYTLTHSEASALLISPDLIEEKRPHLAGHLDRLPLIILDDEVEVARPGPSRRIRYEDAQPESLSSILYTSGTTGLPKGVMVSHFSYEAAGRDMTRSLGLTAEDRIMVFLPLFHANPQMYAVASALTVGACLVLLPKFSASEFFGVARRHKATGFTYVGTVLSILEKANPGEQRDHALRWAVGGGAPSQVWRSIEQRFGIAVRELYGMTETGGWVTMNTVNAQKFGSVGHPRDTVKVEIADDAGRILGTQEKGEIVVRSSQPNLLFSGYWRRPDITAETVKNGWLYTGDRGWLDHDGFLHFDGRIKDLIRRAGEMISPVEIELQLLKHPCVRDCAVIGVADDVLGEDIRAMVVLNGPVEALELNDFLATRIPKHMLPRSFSFIDAIPKTETQKIKRGELAGLRSEEVFVRTRRELGDRA